MIMVFAKMFSTSTISTRQAGHSHLMMWLPYHVHLSLYSSSAVGATVPLTSILNSEWVKELPHFVFCRW